MTESKSAAADREKGQAVGSEDLYNAGNEAASKLLLLHAAVSAGMTNEEGKKLEKQGDMTDVVSFGIPRPQHEVDRDEDVRKEQEKVKKAVEHSKQHPIDPS